MTPERRQELRKWSAGLCKLHKDSFNTERGIRAFYVNEDESWSCSGGDWTPDLSTAPASQILSVIDAMKDLGWKVVMGNNLDRSYFLTSGLCPIQCQWIISTQKPTPSPRPFSSRPTLHGWRREGESDDPLPAL